MDTPSGTFAIGLWLIANLASGLVGAIITTIVYARRETRKLKVDTLKRFAANRYDLKGDEFSRALNEVFVVFNDDAAVMQSLQRFHDSVTSRSADTEDRLIKLYKAMCDATEIKYGDFNDSFFLKPFNTRPESVTATTRKES
jgi:hypothetical protein